MSARPVGEILGDALRELGEREARLAKLTREMAEVKAAIRALRKLVPEQLRAAPRPAAPRLQAPAPTRTPTTMPALPAGRHRDERVFAAIALATEGAEIAVIASGLDLSTNMVRDSINQLFLDGTVRKVGATKSRRYWTTENLDRYVAEHNGQMPDGTAA